MQNILAIAGFAVALFAAIFTALTYYFKPKKQETRGRLIKKAAIYSLFTTAGIVIIVLFSQIDRNGKPSGNKQVNKNTAATEKDTTKSTQLQELEGEIIDATTGLPLKDVVVTLPEFRKTATTDTFGRFGFEINARFQAQVKLRANKTGYEPLNRDVTLSGNLNIFTMGREE